MEQVGILRQPAADVAVQTISKRCTIGVCQKKVPVPALVLRLFFCPLTDALSITTLRPRYDDPTRFYHSRPAARYDHLRRHGRSVVPQAAAGALHGASALQSAAGYPHSYDRSQALVARGVHQRI